jgi:ATP-dependent Lhr-like helicase
LAAFLACLDGLWRKPKLPRGVRVLYISPLKALNNDIQRNLQIPLEGVSETALRLGVSLPIIETAVRTGDTPTSERQRMGRRPPHVLITTPESLHLLLTSAARETLRGVTHVIIDEIHALCPNKRGVFLALLLERLEAIQRPREDGTAGFVRIGLSATQRPLEEVGRFLGGATVGTNGKQEPRPVTLIDAGLRKELDLQIISPVEHFGPLPEKSIWPYIYRLLTRLIQEHNSTLIFTNDRRSVERITSFLNDTEELARAHHGSIALEVRQEIEAALKEGRLPAVVATASLELGIDMGAVDLVCQIASPGNVARALQRVGRAGHLVGKRSKGRLIPRTLGDLLEQAVLAREMAGGRVEAVRVPINCLDVLAQQVVALVSMEDWSVPDLYSLVRQAYPYRDLSPQAFDATLAMISGRYCFAEPSGEEPGPAPLEALQPRVSWDRVHNRLTALPGSGSMALVNGGTIPDTGQYAAYAGSVRIGELDEEFIYERRVGDTFLLGTTAWRLEKIDADRVMLSPAEGAPAMMPFWRGEGGGRTFDLGKAIGVFLRELAARLEHQNCLDWLQQDYFLDCHAARNLSRHVSRQILAAGGVPTDRRLIVEASRDQLGDWQVILLSPFGHRLHLTLRLALEARLHERLGYRPQCLHHDDGILVRLTDCDEPVLDLFDGITPEGLESLVLGELADSALFALRFRQNAARALLLPRGKPGKRAPLWLQRLRGRDLLQVARHHADFPIVAETFRECLHDHLDVPRLRELLEGIRSGEFEMVARRAEAPSPFAAALLFSFTMAYMYQYDGVEKETHDSLELDKQLLGQLVSPESQSHLLDPKAVYQVERRLRGMGQPPRSPTEMAEWLRRLGDLAPADLEGPMRGLLDELVIDGRAIILDLPGVTEPRRWVLAEEGDLYKHAFGLIPAAPEATKQAGEAILVRFLATHALVGLADVLGRYPFELEWAQKNLLEWARVGKAVLIPQGEGAPMQWSAPGNLQQVKRSSLGLLRREVVTCPAPRFADFLARWQGVHPSERRSGGEGVAASLTRLEGLPLPAEIWEQAVLPARVTGFQSRWLDEWISGGAGVFVCQGGDDTSSGLLAFMGRELVRQMASTAPPELAPLTEIEVGLHDLLNKRGASFVTDLAAEGGWTPLLVRKGLWELLRRSIATNDHFDVIRRGQPEGPLASTESKQTRKTRVPSLRARRRSNQRPEGRWALLPWGQPTPEAIAVAQAEMLLERYGIVARELARLDPWLLPWRVLYEVLSRMELAGGVRRGYFVEGLSGAQFALPEAAEKLQNLGVPSIASAPAFLLHSMDPANLYGSGAPFDIDLLDGGTRPLLRRPGNWLVIKAGRPILLAEQGGKRLTTLASASREEVAAAVACLPGVFDRSRSLSGHKLAVEEWNGLPVVDTEGRELLEAAGFVHDYQGLTLYAAWR